MTARRKQKPATPTIKAGSDTYRLSMGTVALIALERVRDMGFMQLPELFEDTRLEALRDLLAAALIEHHPQKPAPGEPGSGMSSLIAALTNTIGAKAIGHAYTWELQQRLADSILDRVGAFEVMRSVGTAFYSSPHLSGGQDAKEPVHESIV